MTQKVLIVDDTELNLILFCALIKKLSCLSFAFSNAHDALAWCMHNEPDLVIADYMMPGINGLEFMQMMREIPGLDVVPVLMITANDQKSLRYRALDMGGCDYLLKPVDKVEFLARAKNMLSLSEARKKLTGRAEWLAQEVKKATAEIVERERETVVRLCKAAEYRDPETGAHILRMAHYSQLIGQRLGLSEDEHELLLEAAPMHDIGKVGISDNILLKPGRLSVEEFEIMKQHTVFGYELLQGSASKTLQAGAAIALGHHEKFDGSGYPYGLKGQDIPLFSRIVAVADVFDALTSERPYKKAWTLEAAVELLQKGANQHFDPECVHAFLAAWDDVLAIRSRFQDSTMLDLHI